MASFEFAGHVLDLRQGRLRRGQIDLPLRRKSLALLIFLLQNRGRVIGKDELISAVWPGIAISDDSLTQCIADIRRSLGSEADGLIRTVPRRGYILDETRVRLVEPAAVDNVHWLVPNRPGTVRPFSRDTALRLVQAEPATSQARHQADLQEPETPPIAPVAATEYRWRGEELDGRWQRVAPYSVFAVVGILSACAALFAPLLGAERTFAHGVAFLVLFAALRRVLVDSLGVRTIAAVQLAATASICFGLSIADMSLHLFEDHAFAETLLMLSVLSTCLALFAAETRHDAVPHALPPLGSTSLLVAAGLVALLLARDPAADPGATVALLSLTFLQVPAILLTLRSHVGRARGFDDRRGSAQVFPLGFISPGCDLIMEADLPPPLPRY